MHRLAAAFALALVAAAALGGSALAATSPYPPASTGYDNGPAQCGSPARGPWGVAAVNGGRPFSRNPCFAEQAAAAAGGGAYINTGYSPRYGDRVTADCAIRAAFFAVAGPVRDAYSIGCSEAQVSEAIASSEAVVPSVWWLDVETLNSWSDSRLDLNQATLQGALDELRTTGAPVGVYSTARQWAEITGAWAPDGLDATWVAGARSAADAVTRCGQGFAGAPVWLVQYVAPLDLDYAC